MVVGTAEATVAAAYLMAKIGRARGFVLGAVTGALGHLTAAAAMATDGFALLCAGAGLVGVANAFVHQYRFAAIESSPPSAAGHAVSLVLVGSLGGAFVGPMLAARGEIGSRTRRSRAVFWRWRRRPWRWPLRLRARTPMPRNRRHWHVGFATGSGGRLYDPRRECKPSIGATPRLRGAFALVRSRGAGHQRGTPRPWKRRPPQGDFPMRNIIALAALAAAVLSAATSQAQTVDICDRTQQVRDALLEALDVDDCAAVDSESLAGVETLDLRSKRLTALRAGDFDDLTGLVPQPLCTDAFCGVV